MSSLFESYKFSFHDTKLRIDSPEDEIEVSTSNTNNLRQVNFQLRAP